MFQGKIPKGGKKRYTRKTPVDKLSHKFIQELRMINQNTERKKRQMTKAKTGYAKILKFLAGLMTNSQQNEETLGDVFIGHIQLLTELRELEFVDMTKRFASVCISVNDQQLLMRILDHWLQYVDETADSLRFRAFESCFQKLKKMFALLPKIGCFSTQTKLIELIVSYMGNDINRPQTGLLELFGDSVPKNHPTVRRIKNYEQLNSQQKNELLYRHLPNLINKPGGIVRSIAMHRLYFDDEPVTPFPKNEPWIDFNPGNSTIEFTIEVKGKGAQAAIDQSNLQSWNYQTNQKTKRIYEVTFTLNGPLRVNGGSNVIMEHRVQDIRIELSNELEVQSMEEFVKAMFPGVEKTAPRPVESSGAVQMRELLELCKTPTKSQTTASRLLNHSITTSRLLKHSTSTPFNEALVMNAPEISVNEPELETIEWKQSVDHTSSTPTPTPTVGKDKALPINGIEHEQDKEIEYKQIKQRVNTKPVNKVLTTNNTANGGYYSDARFQEIVNQTKKVNSRAKNSSKVGSKNASFEFSGSKLKGGPNPKSDSKRRNSTKSRVQETDDNDIYNLLLESPLKPSCKIMDEYDFNLNDAENTPTPAAANMKAPLATAPKTKATKRTRTDSNESFVTPGRILSRPFGAKQTKVTPSTSKPKRKYVRKNPPKKAEPVKAKQEKEKEKEKDLEEPMAKRRRRSASTHSTSMANVPKQVVPRILMFDDSDVDEMDKPANPPSSTENHFDSLIGAPTSFKGQVTSNANDLHKEYVAEYKSKRGHSESTTYCSGCE